MYTEAEKAKHRIAIDKLSKALSDGNTKAFNEARAVLGELHSLKLKRLSKTLV